MKQYFVIIIFLFTSVGTIFSAKPEWIENEPRHESLNFECKVVYSRARTEREAEDISKEKIYEIACKKAGVPLSSKIRFEPVASYYTNDKYGFILLYNLYVIANKADYYGDVATMTKGIPQDVKLGIKRDINLPKKQTPPAYWNEYKTTSYITIPKEEHLNNKKEKGIVKDSLIRISQKELLDRDYALDKSIVKNLIWTDDYYDVKENTIYTMVYITKDRLISQYSLAIDRLLKRAKDYVNNAIEKESAPEEYQEWLVIRSLYENAQEICDSINISLLPKLQQYVSITDFDARVTNLTHTIDTRLPYAKQKSQDCYVSNLQDWLKIAYEAETKSKKIATALEYYYASYLYWKAKNNNIDTIKLTVQEKILCFTKESLKNHIVQILKTTQIHCVRQNNTEMNLYFFADDGEPISNMAYWYNVGSGENSHIQFCQNGGDVLEMRDCTNITHIHIRIDFRATDLIGDNVLKDAVRKYATSDRELDDAAIHNSIMVEDKLSYEISHPTISSSTTDCVANALSKFQETYVIAKNNIRKQGNLSQLTEIDDPHQRKPYEDIIAKICNGINKSDIESLRSYFSDNGYIQLKKMVYQAPIKVRAQASYMLICCMNEVYVRSIPATIRYKSRNNKDGDVKESIVFVFDSTMHIDGVQFALDGSTANTIMKDQSIDLISRYSIVNFLENYRTAYALKRLDYIRDVFADDAVFIIGRVLSKAPRLTDGYTIQYGDAPTNIRYTHPDKNQYLKCLERNFKANEWINIVFTSASIEQPNKAIARYGMNLRQEYSSQHYSDDGYLYLIVDLDKEKRPIIHLRAWTPDGRFGFSDYEKLLRKQ